MACTHLKELYQLCQTHGLEFSSLDLVRIVCKECGSEETCPSNLTAVPETEETNDSIARESGSADGAFQSDSSTARGS